MTKSLETLLASCLFLSSVLGEPFKDLMVYQGFSRRKTEDRTLCCCLLSEDKLGAPVATTENRLCFKGVEGLTSSLSSSYLGISELPQIMTKQTENPFPLA